MPQQLRVLIVEDTPDDALLMVAELRRAGYEPVWQRVDTEAAYLAALGAASPSAPDIVLSDYSLPGFNGLSALKLLLAGGHDIPFILVSGTMGEDIAVQALKLGASDYLLKDRMARLGQSAGQALEAKALRAALQRRKALERLTVAISTRFLGSAAAQLEPVMLRALRDVGEFAGADYSGIHQFSADHVTVLHNYEWHNAEHAPDMLLDEFATAQNFAWTAHKLMRNELIYAASLDDLPAEASSERALWQRQGMRSILIIPQMQGDVLYGSYTLTVMRSHFDWDVEDLAMFKLLGDIFANAIVRMQAEEQLWRERNLLRTVIDQLPDRIYAKDRAGRFILGNAALFDSIGRAQNEILGKDDRDFYSADDVINYEADEQNVMTTGNVISGQTEVTHDRSGGVRWTATFKAPLHDELGQIVGLVGIGRDITERKLAADALRESEERFRLLYEQAPLGYEALDEDGNFLDVNQAWLDALGYSREEVIGKWFGDFLTPSNVPLFKQRFPVFKAAGTAQRLEFDMVHRDGSTVIMSIDARVARDANGKFIQSHGILTDITERRRTEKIIREQLATITALYNGAKGLSASLDLQVLIDEATRTCVETFGARLAWIGRAETDGRVSMMSQYPLDHDYPRRFKVRWDDTPNGSGPAGIAIRTGAPVVARNLLKALAHVNHPEYARDAGFTCGAVFPLPGRGRTYGALMVYFDTPDVLTQERIQFYESYALQLAAALENALLFEQTTRRLQRVQSLNAIDVAMTSSLERATVLNVILEEVVKQLSVDATSVLLLDPKTHILTNAANRGFHTDELKKTHLELGEEYAGRVALHQRMIAIIASPGEEGPFDKNMAAAEEGFRTYYGVPLIINEQVLGVLEVFHRAALNPDAEWLDFLQTLAAQSAIALHASAMFNDLERANTELVEAYEATIEGWSHALDMRDSDTKGHSGRVTQLTMQLARIMGVSDPELHYLHWGALLHDIGKINVPDSILLKPGPLTNEEMAIMRRHPLNAYNMLLPIHYLEPALEIPYCHHERWDGTGYPRGLKGEQIPLGARIIAVVDVWDALLSERPYRKAWGREQALQYLREQAGTQFDASVVEAFLKMEGG